MKHLEKKFLVDSFTDIENLLKELGAEAHPRSITNHYYAQVPSLDVIKMVVYEDRAEIHILKEHEGMFELIDRITVNGEQAGKTWLREHGYSDLTYIKMDSVEYAYQDGVIGLYTVNDSLSAIILDFPQSQQEHMTKLFGLKNAKRITQPFNKFFEEITN